MNRILLAFILSLLFLSTANSATLFHSEDFEDNADADTYGTNTESYWDDHNDCTSVVTNVPNNGTYAFRGSISENGTLDDITGQAGCLNPRNTIGLGPVTYGNTSDFLISSMVSGEIYVSWYHRFDQGELANLLGDSHKMFRVYTVASINDMILHIFSSGGMELLVNCDNQAGFPYTAGDANNGCIDYGNEEDCLNDVDCMWRTEPGKDLDGCNEEYKYGYDVGTFPDDGNYHHFEFYLKYGTGGNNDSEIKLTIDDVVKVDISDAVVIFTTGDKATSSVLPTNISAAGTTVTTVGWQVDDIEYWDGEPDAASSPYTLSGCSISGGSIN